MQSYLNDAVVKYMKLPVATIGRDSLLMNGIESNVRKVK